MTKLFSEEVVLFLIYNNVVVVSFYNGIGSKSLIITHNY